MADQATLNQEQITKVRQALSLNIYATDTGKENYSPSRIRKGGKWKAQGKIGD